MLSNEWRPISTAPKDGTYVLVKMEDYVPSVAKWESSVGAWIESHKDIDEVDCGWRPDQWMKLPE